MPRRRALFFGLLIASSPAPALAQEPTRPITPVPMPGLNDSRPPQPAPPATGSRLQVPSMEGAAAQSTGGGRALAAPSRPGDDDDRLRRLDPNSLAGGAENLAGGDYGVVTSDPQTLSGGDYGLPARETDVPTATIAPTDLTDPLAVAPRGFRSRRLPPLRRLRDEEPPGGVIVEPDQYEAAGIRAGSFLLRPTVESAVGFDTNPDRLRKPKSSAYIRERGEFAAQSDWSRHELAFRSSAQMRKDLQIKGAKIEPEVNAALNGRLDVTDRTQINSELRASIAAARPGDPDTEVGIKGNEINRNVGATLGVAQRFNRLSLRLDGLVDRYTTDDAKLLDGGGKVDNADRAYNQYEARLRGSYEISRRLEPFVEAAVDTRDYDRKFAIDQPNRRLGSDGWALRGGARFELTRLITGEAALGYGRRDPNDRQLKKVDGLLIDGAIAWAPTALTTVRFTARSGFQETTQPQASGVLTRTFEASVEHRLRRNLSVTARAGFDRADYQGTNPHRVDDTVTLALDGEYRLNRSVALTTSLQQLWLDSRLRNEDYKASIIEFGLRVRR